METSVTSVADARTDLDNLLSCVKCHEDSGEVEIIKEALKTIVVVCSNCNEGKDIFRELGGLTFLFHLMCRTKSILLLETCMKTLACVLDQNVYNQKLMSRKEVFELLRGIINCPETAPSLMKNAVLFATTLLFQNNEAQTLFQQTQCLQDFISIYEHTFPVFLLDHVLSEKWDNIEMNLPSIEMWLLVNVLLCFAVNNPLNEKNQAICSVLFPLALRILQSSSNCKVITAVSSFLSVTIANNVHNQNLFAEYDGAVVLKHCLFKGVNSMLQDVGKYENVFHKGYAQGVLSVVEVMDIVLSDHSQNSELVGKLGCISLLLKLLSIDVIDDVWKTKVMLTLGHCIDACGKNMTYLLEEERFMNLLKAMMLSGSEDLLKACQYLIEVCVRNGTPLAEQCTVENPSVNKQHDRKTVSDIRNSNKTIDLSSTQTQDIECVNVHQSQEECVINTVCGNNMSDARNRSKLDCIPPEQSSFHRNLVNVEARFVASPYNSHTSKQDENRLYHCESSCLPSQQPFAERMTQACDEDEEIFVIDVEDKRTQLRCDYCSCESHVISEYRCGCFVLHSCHCENMRCMNVNSHHLCPRLLGKARTSSECSRYGCEKRCENTSLCVNPRKLYRKGLDDKCVKHSEEKHRVANKITKPDEIHTHSKVSSSKRVSKFLPQISLCKTKTTHQNIHPPPLTLQTPLKENKSINLDVAAKSEPVADVFKKPQGMPCRRHAQNVPQGSKGTKSVSRFYSSKSDVNINSPNVASFHHSQKCVGTVNKMLVSFSPFRKVDFHETQVNHKRNDSNSVSQGPPSEISVNDAKLLKTPRASSASCTYQPSHERRTNIALQKVKPKCHQNNENTPSGTISKYFVSSRQYRKQGEFAIKDSHHVKSDVPIHIKHSPCKKRKFSLSGPSADEDLATDRRNVNTSDNFHIKPGAEATAKKNSSYDNDIKVLSVFGSICSKHDLTSRYEVINIALES